MKLTDEQKTSIFVALGEVSMCWSEDPKGIFDSTRAQNVGNGLIKILEKEEINEWKYYNFEKQ